MLLSSGFQTGVTDSFDLINTTRTATSILTAEVRKITRAGADDRVLEALYPLPVGATGQNLRAFSDQTATQHDQSLAALWLFTVVGLYEVWAAELPMADAESGCQFPTKGYVAGAKQQSAGVSAVLNTLPASSRLANIYNADISADSRLIERARIDDALVIYRLIKECRNSLAHAGGIANARVEQWSHVAKACATDLFVDRQAVPLPLPLFSEGDRVTIAFDQMRAFVSLLFRIVFTIDSAVLISTVGEAEISRRWAAVHGSEPVKVQRKKLHRGLWVSARFAAIDAPVPGDEGGLIAYMLDRQMIREIF